MVVEFNAGMMCDRCSVAIVRGAPHTIMTLTLTSGFDGVLPEIEGDLALKMAQVVASTGAASAEDLEESVHMQRAYILCPSCHKVIANDPLRNDGESTKGRIT
jgi:hypothetical protein